MDTILITTESGTSQVDCFWRNEILAVTRDVGCLKNDGGVVPPAEDAWTITHLGSGRRLGGHGWTDVDPAVLRSLIEHLTPLAPWHSLSLEELLGNPMLRATIVGAARDFWDSRDLGED